MQQSSMPGKGTDDERPEAQPIASVPMNDASCGTIAASPGAGFGLPPMGNPSNPSRDAAPSFWKECKKRRPALLKLESALRSWPAAGEGVHAHVMRCACLARQAGLKPDQAAARIRATMPRAPSPASEVTAAIHKAYATSGGAKSNAPPARKFLPLTRTAFIRRGDGASEANWLERSPIRIDWEPGPRDALAVLDALWLPDELLFVDQFMGNSVNTVREWRMRFAMGLPVPPHVIPNPLRPDAGTTQDGKPSHRCDDSVVSFRYAVAEFDVMDKAEQLAFWWGFRSAPIAALIDSGGKSIHAWLRVDCPDRATWERDVEQVLFGKVLIPLGCDPACRNESRLSRMPGHFRRENNAWQRLLFLDPKGGAR